MIAALADGTIDVIASFHTPADEESKRLPFEEAAPGAVALETLLPAAMRLYHGGHLTLPALFRAMALNPARRLGLPQGRLATGAPADLVLFDPDAPFQMDRFALRSKSKNTPFDGARMEGKVIGTWVGGTRVFAARRIIDAGTGHRYHDPADRGRFAPICWGRSPSAWSSPALMGLGDLRAIGSGNIGATNVLRTGNKRRGPGHACSWTGPRARLRC